MSFTLELFDTPEITKVLCKCKRVLRPGGRVLVDGVSKEGGHDPLIGVFERTHKHFPDFLDCRPIYVCEELAKAGFKISKALMKHICGFRWKSFRVSKDEMAVTYAKDELQSLRWRSHMDEPNNEQRPPNRGGIGSTCGSAFDVRLAQPLSPIHPAPRTMLVIHQPTKSEARETWRNEGSPN
jgi:hypothetical protein